MIFKFDDPRNIYGTSHDRNRGGVFCYKLVFRLSRGGHGDINAGLTFSRAATGRTMPQCQAGGTILDKKTPHCCRVYLDTF